jgi:hypothetical protein
MADEKIKIEVDVEGNVVESLANLRKLKQALKEVPAGTADWNKIKNDIRDVEDALESAGQSSEDLKGLLENAPGPLGVLGGAIKKVELATKSWGAAIKATGIGLLVSTIGLLVGAFAKTEGSLKKLEPVLIMFEKLLGGLVEAFQPLIEGFANVALKILPVFITGIKNFYGGLLALFTLVKEVGTGVAKILKGIFTLDVASAKEGLEQLQGSWDKTKASFNEFTDNFEKGYAKQTKTQKENLKKQNEDAQKALDEKIKRLEAENKLDEAQLAKLKEQALALAKTEQEKLDVEKRFAKLSYDARIKDIEEKQALYSKDSIEFKNLQAEKITAETEYIKSTSSFNEQQKKLDEDALKSKADFAEREKQIQIAAIKDTTDRAIADREAKYQKDLADLEKDKEFIKKSEEEKAKLRKDLLTASENDIAKIRTENQLKQAAIAKGEDDARYARLAAGAQFDLELQRSLLEQKKAADDAYYANALANENLTAEQIRELNEKKLSDQIFYTEKSNEIERNRIAVKQQALSDIISIAGAETNVGRAALVAKQVLAAKELIMEVSRTITFSAQAAARSTVAVAEGTAQTAKVGFPQNIPLLIGYAAQAVGIILAIKSAVSNAKSAAAMSGAGGAMGGMSSSSTNIAPPTIAATAAPQIQTAGGMNPTTQIAQTIGNAQAPIRAYVVSQDISSQQALDRRTNRAATFVGG